MNVGVKHESPAALARLAKISCFDRTHAVYLHTSVETKVHQQQTSAFLLFSFDKRLSFPSRLFSQLAPVLGDLLGTIIKTLGQAPTDLMNLVEHVERINFFVVSHNYPRSTTAASTASRPASLLYRRPGFIVETRSAMSHIAIQEV